MSIFKLNLIDQQYEGARTILQQLDDLPPVQIALQQIEREAPLLQIAKTLRQSLLPFYQQQDQRIWQLERDLRLQTEARQRLEEQVQSWYHDSLQKQVSAAKAAAERSSRSQQATEKSLRVTEEILERERLTHAQKVHSLNEEIVGIIRLIYSASYDANLPVIDQAAMPYASLYLLKEYLSMRKLDGMILGELRRGARDTRWNITTITHKMQAVINTFLSAHGWRSDGLLRVYAKTSDWESTSGRVFNVKVRINSAEILMFTDDLVVPSKEEIMEIECALSWTLWSLFEYSGDLGLGRIEFW